MDEPNESRKSDLGFGPIYGKVRRELSERIGSVDAHILISVISQDPEGFGRRRPDFLENGGDGFFSDWPDTYNRDTWYKTWGKAESLGVVLPEGEIETEG